MNLLNRTAVHVAIVVVLGLALYSHTLHAPFCWDDTNFTQSPLVKNLANFSDLESASKNFGRRFFGYLTFAINYRLHGLDVAGYHVVNIGIHLLAALLVYRLVLLTFRTPVLVSLRNNDPGDERSRFIALLTALLFVAHPIQTQAVTYIVQRFASLATMFYLLSLTCYVRARLARGSVTATVAWFAAALVSAVLAMNTKEIAFTLPLIAVLYEVIFFGCNLKKKVIAVLAAVFILGAGLFLFTSVLSGGSIADMAHNLDKATRLQTDMSRWDYLATQFTVIVVYLRLLLVPAGQRIDYDYPVYDSFLDTTVLLSGILLVSLVGVACYCLYRSRNENDERAGLLRVIAAGIFWFFITLAIESSIIPIVDVIFEHRLYLPSAGLFMAVAATVSYAGGAGSRLPGWPRMNVVAGVALAVLLLAGGTAARNRLWSNEVAFWEDSAWKAPEKARVVINLARARERSGELDGAIVAYVKASLLDPYQTDTLLNLGLIYTQMGRYPEALTQFEAALAIDPSLVEAHNNIGKVYGLQNRLEEALRKFQQVVKLKPDLPEPHNNVGQVYVLQKRHAEAVAEFNRALALNPGYEQAYTGRGKSLLALGRKKDAIADFQRALTINPASAEAQNWLQQAMASGN